jgi:predicted amidohydrolase
VRVAVIQLSSQDNVADNLARVRQRVAEAAKLGAKLITLPENFAFTGGEDEKRKLAESIAAPGPIVQTLLELARKHDVHLVAGGFPEQSADVQRPYNCSLMVNASGVVAAYRKIHLFDVSLADGTSLQESTATLPGNEPVVADVLGVGVGMTICYDLRFPELFRALLDSGARIVTVPAAFTMTTGKDHWHVLLRARAIENQVYVLAPAQHGKHPLGRQTYGKSIIVDPWGDVIAQVSEGEGVAVADFDLGYQEGVRASLPCLLHRKL